MSGIKNQRFMEPFSLALVAETGGRPLWWAEVTTPFPSSGLPGPERRGRLREWNSWRDANWSSVA